MTYTEIMRALEHEGSLDRQFAWLRGLPQADRVVLNVLQWQRHWKGFSDWFGRLEPQDQDAFFDGMRSVIEPLAR
jgi:hypothetical protein